MNIMSRCLLELFKGTGSAGKAFEGYYIESIDNEQRFNPTHCTDILDWDYKSLSFIPDVIWASPPCNSYSNLAAFNRMRSNETMLPSHPRAVKDDKVLSRTIEIIKYFLNLNPNLKYCIENPRGTMHRSPVLKELGTYDTAITFYFFYNDNRRKRTQFFNNFNLQLIPVSEWNQEEWKLRGETVHRMSIEDKYRIPQDLLLSVRKQIEELDSTLS